jgi:hypothetical protein
LFWNTHFTIETHPAKEWQLELSLFHLISTTEPHICFSGS